MSFLNRVSLRAKLSLLIASCVLAVLAVSLLMLEGKRERLLEERKNAVAAAVESMWSTLDLYQRQAASGAISEQEARTRAVAAVNAARYGAKEYFWINDAEPRMVVHPTKPELNGQNLAALRTPEGQALFVEIAAMVRRNGGGYIRYAWPRPGSEVPVPKISYVKGLASWGWMVGSGVYVDDVDAAFWADVRHLAPWLIAISGLLVGLGWILAAQITRRLHQAADFADAVAAGDLSRSLHADGHDEPARMLQALGRMCQNLRERHDAEHAVLLGNQRILSALDCARTNVRIVDNEGTIIYINQALRATLHEVTPKLRQTIPDFSVDTVIGRSIGIFYADPQAALARLRNLSSAVSTRMDIGGRTFDVVTNPILDADGHKIGTVGEWVDRTEQLRVEQELKDLIAAAASGNYEKRLDADGKQGFYLDLVNMLNGLMQNTASGMSDLARVLGAVARGDLTVAMQGEYQGTLATLRDDANATVQRLREVVGQIQGAAHVIHVAAREIASGNNDLSVRTERQASGIEGMASAIEEIHSSTRRNASNASQANELARQSAQTTEQGGKQMNELVRSMGAIQESSRRIGEIVGVIDSIAFQTNILALNAAVEAARAGEEGRGFSVVAAEVRNLAQRSAEAAREIKALISSSGEHVDHGATLVNDTGDTIRKVVDSFRSVTGYVSEIATASGEQSLGVEKLATAVSEIDDSTQKNAALVEEATAAAQSLEEQASALVDAVSLFSLN